MGGLATLPGLGGYTTTKFAVVAFSETLAAELEAEGSRVGVTVLCPGPVRSNIKTSHRIGPRRSRAEASRIRISSTAKKARRCRWLDPEQVGDVVVRAIRRGDLYALTHPEMAGIPAARHERIAAAFEVCCRGRAGAQPK